MKTPEMPHPKHDEHLCYLQNMGYIANNLEEYKKLVRNPKFVCKNCGRTAASDSNLCRPEPL
jgi:hypothetical protein